MTRRLMILRMVTILMLGAMPLLAHDVYRIVGTVTKRTADQLDVKTEDGRIIVIGMSKDTPVWRDKMKVAGTELKVGLTVVADATGDSEDDLSAMVITIVPPIAPSPTK